MNQGRENDALNYEAQRWTEGDNGDLGFHETSEHAMSWSDYMAKAAQEQAMASYVVDAEQSANFEVKYEKLSDSQQALLLGVRLAEFRYAAQAGLEVRESKFNPDFDLAA